jgi:predicted anti-sigma-YlaC factor YlaD
MTKKPDEMSCEVFQSQLADLIGSGEDISNHPHLKSCPRCRALLDDLQTIAEAARQLLPAEPPEDNLWERIESAIQLEEKDGPQ